jgi:predicted Zn-dependent protease
LEPDAADDGELPEDYEPVEETTAEGDSQDDLINNFIEAEKQGTLFVPDTPPAETKGAEAMVEKIRDSAFLTESLAKIYIKQHKYAQALSIIRDLSLKYPEKNVYFADQIRFLEKIIDYKTNKNN